MPSQTHLIDRDKHPLFNIMGPRVQFLIEPADTAGAFGLIRGIVAPGVAVPLHSHPDPEVIFILEGALEFLQNDGVRHRWVTASSGEIICIPPDVKHALRNGSTEPVTLLLVTTPNIYGLFRELGSPDNPNQPSAPLTPENMQRLLTLAAKRNYWMASPQENTAIGLSGF